MKGKLYIIATPIGNLGDITLRALEVLKDADIIAAEDTRHTLKLLNHFEIKKKLISFHKYSDEKKYDEIINLLKENKVALVSDAGTPTISDPGYELIKLAIENNVEIESIPGACAAITALSLCGMKTSNFAFYGFLDTKKIKVELERIKNKELLSVIYESPKRIKKTLKCISEVFEDTQVALFRELTKKFEECIRGSAFEIFEKISQKEEIKGEIVIVIDEFIKPKEVITDENIIKELETCIKEGMSKKDAINMVSKVLNINKNRVYSLMIG